MKTVEVRGCCKAAEGGGGAEVGLFEDGKASNHGQLATELQIDPAVDLEHHGRPHGALGHTSQ